MRYALNFPHCAFHNIRCEEIGLLIASLFWKMVSNYGIAPTWTEIREIISSSNIFTIVNENGIRFGAQSQRKKFSKNSLNLLRRFSPKEEKNIQTQFFPIHCFDFFRIPTLQSLELIGKYIALFGFMIVFYELKEKHTGILKWKSKYMYQIYAWRRVKIKLNVFDILYFSKFDKNPTGSWVSHQKNVLNLSSW